MNRRQQFLWSIALGLSTVAGCQTPSFWSKKEPTYGSAAPDVARQRYESLAGGGSPAATSGKSLNPAAPPAPKENSLTSAWKKSTAAVASALTIESPKDTPDDPTSLSSAPKKVTPQVYVAAARMMETQGKFDDAQKQYEKALLVDPKELSALVGVARLHDRQGRSAKAISYYQQAAKAHPKVALVQNDLGLCYGRMQQWRESTAAFSRACTLAPDNARYRNNLAMALVETGDEAGALKQLSAGGPPAVAHYNLAFILAGKGRQDEATRHLQQAIALDPGLAPARELLAQMAPAALAPAQEAPGSMAASGAAGPYAQYAPPRVAALPASLGGVAPQISPSPASAPVFQPAAAPAPGPATFRISDEPSAAPPSSPAPWQFQPAPASPATLP